MDIEIKQPYSKVSLVVELTSQMNQLLTQSAERSKRSKTKEAAVRLEDHLINFGDIATVGQRFQTK